MYQFTITIASDGRNVNGAWDEAVSALAMDPGTPPEDYVLLNENDEECEKHEEGAYVFWTDPAYWNCDCDKPYIHSKEKGNYCPVCKVYESDSPNSKVDDIAEKYDEKYDTAVKAPNCKTNSDYEDYSCPLYSRM